METDEGGPALPVRWGVLGAGGIARAVAPAIRAADGCALQAVGARDVARAAALGPVSAYGSYAEVLADPDVDAVYVALANDAHLPWTLAALEAGKPVLCEKPLCLTAAQVDEVAAASARTGLPVVEASWYRWHPRVRLAQRRLPEVGPVLHVAAGFTFAADWVARAADYRLDPALGGGALYDVGCYAVSACLWAVGRGLPDEVVARGTLSPSGVDLEAQLLLSWDARDGLRAVEAEVVAGMTTAQGQWLVVSGERGEVELRGTPFTAVRGQDTELWVSDGTGTDRIPVAAADAYRLMVEACARAFRGGDAWVLPLAESRQTAAVLDAARASIAAGSSGVRPA